jgi:hypothetical protein
MEKEALFNFLGFSFLLLTLIAIALFYQKTIAIQIAMQTKCWNTPYRNLVLNYTETLLKQQNLANSIQNLTIEYCNTLLARK